MKTEEQLAATTTRKADPPSQGAIPFTPSADELPGLDSDAPIERPPQTVRRTLKVKLHRCGPSLPIPIIDPRE